MKRRPRFELIDPMLIDQRGWRHTDMLLEVTARQIDIVYGKGQRRPTGRTDYLLCRRAMSTKLQLLDTVALAEDRPLKALTRGQVGTIVEELGDGVFEVEFADETGEAYAFAALPEAALMKLVCRRLPAQPVHR